MSIRLLGVFVVSLFLGSSGSAQAAQLPLVPRLGTLPAVGSTPWMPGPEALAASEPWIITTTVRISEPTEVGDIIVAAGGRLIVEDVAEPGLSITGNLWVVQSGSAELRNSTIRFLGIYNGQYALAAADDATVLVDGCDYRIPNHVQHGLIAAGNASLTLRDTAFDDVQLLALQHGRLLAQRLDGHFEVILQEQGDITLEDIPKTPGGGNLWVWPTFPEGSQAVYSPPTPGFIESWDFPPAGAAGIDQACHVERCQVLLWPLLVQPGSDLTLRDIDEDNWVVVGLHLPNAATISGLVDGGPPATGTLDLADRTLRLDNAAIDTWNLYPEGQGHVTVRDCTVGEIIAFEDASLVMERTTVDGSGGYFGASNSAYVVANDSIFTCTVESTENATIELHRCSALPYPSDPTGAFTRFGAYDTARLLADATTVNTTPALGGSGLIAVTWIVNPPSEPPAWGSSAEISGIAAVFSADPEAALSSWELRAVPKGGFSGLPLGNGTENVEEPEPLGTWHGGDPYVPWELRLILWDGFGRILSGGVPVPAAAPGDPRAVRPKGKTRPQ